MRKMIEAYPDDDELIKSVAEAAAADFLKLQLNNVEAKIKAQEDHLEHFRPADETIRLGSHSLLDVYRQEKGLIEDLMSESQNDIFINLLFRHLDRVERKINDDLWRGSISGARDEKSRRLRREREILNNLLIEWKRWLRN